MDLKIDSASSLTMPEVAKVKEKEVQDDFSFTLNRIDEKGLRDRLYALIEDISAQGARLAEHMDIKDMKNYRGLVKDFINEVITHSHQFSRENFLDRRGRHRVYGIVKLVDKNLDELAQELLKSEKDQIKILDKADEIRGLLLDIIV